MSEVQERFNNSWKMLSDSTKIAIADICGENWKNDLTGSNNPSRFDNLLEECNNSLSTLYDKYQVEAIELQNFGRREPDLATLNRIFPEPEYREAVLNIRDESQKFREIQLKAGNMNEHTTENPSQKLIRKSASIGLVEKARSKQSFYGEREAFLQHYGCPSSSEGGSVVGCLAEAKISQKDRKCLEKSGFKRCRPFLEECDKSDKINALKRLHTELSKDNERA